MSEQNAWAETDRMSPSPEQEIAAWEDEEAVRLGVAAEPHEPLSDRLKPVLLRSLIGFWSDVDEVRQRAGINVGASMHSKRGLDGLVADGLAECSGSDLQYRLTDEGRVARAKVEATTLGAHERVGDK